jgi:hypothetical protein
MSVWRVRSASRHALSSSQMWRECAHVAQHARGGNGMRYFSEIWPSFSFSALSDVDFLFYSRCKCNADGCLAFQILDQLTCTLIHARRNSTNNFCFGIRAGRHLSTITVSACPKIRTRNPNPKSEPEIRTRNPTPKSEPEIRTRNPNPKSEPEIRTRNPNPKSEPLPPDP